jgi:hypothetical protein
MIHPVILRNSIYNQLVEVLHLQEIILGYAVETEKISETDCSDFLGQFAHIGLDRARRTARWIWASRFRREPLEQFARGPRNGKRYFHRRVIVGHRLFDIASGRYRRLGLLDSDPRSKKASYWQKGGREFLLQFYADFRSVSGLPSYLFSNNKRINGQDFLHAFEADNPNVIVCPVCDVSDPSTKDNDEIRVELDHYLPKALYPHLSCHPYNLVPVCHHCNSTIKGATDILDCDNRRYNLDEVLLPYREPGLKTRAYLEVILGDSIESASFDRLISLKNHNIDTRIKAFNNTYRIPNRWIEKADAVGEILFRRVRQMMRNVEIEDDDYSLLKGSKIVLYNTLYNFTKEDIGKDPYVFVMTYWIKALIDREVRPLENRFSGGVSKKSKIIEELFNMYREEKSLQLGTAILDNRIVTELDQEYPEFFG